MKRKNFASVSLQSESYGSFSLPFRFISLRSENYKSFSLPFRFILLWSENEGSFSLPFRLISPRSENDGSFLLLIGFVFASFHFRFASDFYVSHRCETLEKTHFFASKRKKFHFRFALFRFEARMTGHPRQEVLGVENKIKMRKILIPNDADIAKT